MPELQDRVSANLRVLMALAQESHDDVADALDLSRPAVSARLNGRTAWSLVDLAGLAAHYGKSPDYFFQDPAVSVEQLRAQRSLVDPLGRRRRRPSSRRRRPGEPGPAAQAI